MFFPMSAYELLRHPLYARKSCICLQANENSSAIYVLYKDKNMKEPWLYFGMWQFGDLWLCLNKYYWYQFGTLPLTIIRNWIHFCLEVNIDLRTIKLSINGGEVRTSNNISFFLETPVVNVYLR